MNPANKLPDHVVGRILEDFAQTQNQTHTARRLGIAQTTVSRILIRNGIRVGTGKHHIHRLPMPEIIQRYQSSSDSVSQVARDYGVDPEMLRRRLVKLGVTIRPTVRKRANQNPFWKGADRYRDSKYHARQIAEICLGYKPSKGSVIHHMDENPQNNDPSNLRLFPSQAEHGRYHVRLLALQRQGLEVSANRLASETGGLEIPPLPAGFSLSPDKARLLWPLKKMPTLALGRLTYRPSEAAKARRRARRKS